MRNRPDSVMLFAAGFGTRMRELTHNQPKPLVRVAGRPLIDHTLDLVREIQPSSIVANLHYKPERLLEHLSGTEVVAVLEDPDILDTGGGLKNALPLLGDGPMFTSNTDAIWQGENPFDLLSAAWDPDRMDALLMCVPPERAVGHTGKGDFLRADDGRLHRGPGAIYGGIQILKTGDLRQIPDKSFSLNLVWDRIIARDRLFGVTYPGRWCDVGSPEGVAQAENLIGNDDV